MTIYVFPFAEDKVEILGFKNVWVVGEIFLESLRENYCIHI